MVVTDRDEFCYPTFCPFVEKLGGMRKPFCLIVFVGWLFFEVPVDAYLDPGAGSMLLQILLGGFAALGVIGKLYWNRLTSLFNRKDPHGNSR